MMRGSGRSFLALALTLVVGGAAWAEEGAGAVRPSGAAEPARAPALRSGLPSLESLSATRERPLFRPDRRPPPPSAATAPASGVAAESGGVAAEGFAPTLVGLVSGPGFGMALLRDPSGSGVVRLHLDEEWEGWRLASVAERAATFRRGDEEVTVDLKRPESASGTPGGGDGGTGGGE